MNYPLYNDKLAPIWNINEDGARLDDEVRKSLIKIAMDFVQDLKKNQDINIKIEDILLIGSITNYNWTPYSDIDLHISTDFSKLDMTKEQAQAMFDAIKAGWNNKHDIVMKNFDVELYVEDIGAEQVSASKYSVLRNEWIKEPKKESPNFNKALIKKKYKEYSKKIDDLMDADSEKPLKDLLEKIYKFRQAGLDKGGELSEENIVFKILRAKGKLDKLKDTVASIYDDKMSVDESEKINISDIHKLADKKGIKWDNEPSFLKLTKRITGKEHLDDLDQLGLKKMMAHLDKKMGVDEIAMNNSYYEKDVQDAADDIYAIAKALKVYPDIEPYIKKISLKYKKYSDDVHIDIARAFSKLRKQQIKTS